MRTKIKLISSGVILLTVVSSIVLSISFNNNKDTTILQLERTKLYWNGSSIIGYFELWSNPSNTFVYEVRIRNEIAWSGEEEVYGLTILTLPLKGISIHDIGITVNGELISDQGTCSFCEVVSNE